MTILSLTSIPPRFDGLGPVLESLLAQGADRVVLVVCRAYARFPGVVSAPPLPGGVELMWSDDIGPATKVIPVQRAFASAPIAYCDDDCIYAPGWLAALERVGGPGRVVAGSVFDLSRLKRRGGMVAQGFAGVLLPPGTRFDPPPDACRAADDLWLSAQIQRAGLDIVHCPDARAKLSPRVAPTPLQDQDRAGTYRRAAAHIHATLGIWPATDAPD